MTVLIFLSRFSLAFPSHLSSAFLLVAELTAAFAFFVSSQTPRFMDEEYCTVPYRTGKSVCYFGLLYHTGTRVPAMGEGKGKVRK